MCTDQGNTTRSGEINLTLTLTINLTLTLKKFISVARFTGSTPRIAYAELEDNVRSIGLQPCQVINFGKKKWDTPSPNNKKGQLGMNRNALAGSVLLNILQHLQKVCGLPTRSFLILPCLVLSSLASQCVVVLLCYVVWCGAMWCGDVRCVV